ncbi:MULTISPECIES: winged helix-turn-helix transcriptional regulator [Methanoculleus]|uniref:Helix-turn-helix, type 11 domain protein n=2 Tax=Methanoculleus TaxID=45989 RepID=A3CXA5_METMJ|nr:MULTISPECIES: winged helix-turn-helix transcriptional regulator [Methanoculleus]ABN58005.1 Helix-turn-helix, type 11 domain protein [Methanoculleus marisnigri JR1]MCC7554670.1 winged helix-turn-helix transcriptional regulator [Methanoculleus marisnigri]UYU19388.1 winged helix-turn-helix transcriptional regulator [Methanoculleus submarinus]
MVRWSRIFSILFVAVTFAGISLPGTATAGYAVEPALEGYPGELYDFEKSTLQEKPLLVMFFHCLLVILPACFFPGELLYILSIFLPFGFRRVTKRTILDDDFRLNLYRKIAANPGAGAVELGEMTGVSRGRLRYHLNMLIREGKVAAVDYRNRTGHFARNQRHTDLEQRILISLREEPSRTILRYLLGSPETTRNDVAERLGLTGSTVSQHMQELKTEGIVTVGRDGRFVRYRLSEDAEEFFNQCLDDLPISRHPSTGNYRATRGHEDSSG